MPDRTLGWEVLAWCGLWLKGKRDKPWQYTAEQARFILWFYALDEAGQFAYHSAVLQRLKGWGKDPLAATLALASMLAPIDFDHWDEDGEPVGRDSENAWVQLVAVSQEQTKNTMKLMPGLITAEAREFYGIQPSRLNVWALGDTRQIEAVTNSVMAIEGGRPTLVVRNETQNWNSSNGGHDMAGALEGNAAKRDIDSPARMLDICNAYRPGEDSVGQRMREAYESTLGDVDDPDSAPKAMDFGVLYDSLEAPPEAPLTAEAAPSVVEAIRGDAVWLDAKGRILKSILNPANPPSESRRKWYNQITAREDAYLSPQEIDPLKDESKVVRQGEEIVMFFDGAKTDDATGLVGCRVSDGHVFVIGMWQRPPGERGKDWVVPRNKVDYAVDRAFSDYRVSAFWGDPSHVLDDESKDRFWDGLFDQWHRKYGRRLKLWADGKKHSVMFDMADFPKQKDFVGAVEAFLADVEDENFTWDGDIRLRQHFLNAVRMPTRAGLSIGKEHRESKRKIDLAVCAIGARMVRRAYLNNAKKRGGKAW
ncbi:terminase [Jonesia denitrificans]|uniref:terminase n=1 Tax=Jonesia denitrificans TaxID=43674 RepID=UPI00031B6973|nr:terminase [Jonesia denitrificans]